MDPSLCPLCASGEAAPCGKGRSGGANESGFGAASAGFVSQVSAAGRAQGGRGETFSQIELCKIMGFLRDGLVFAPPLCQRRSRALWRENEVAGRMKVVLERPRRASFFKVSAAERAQGGRRDVFGFMSTGKARGQGRSTAIFRTMTISARTRQSAATVWTRPKRGVSMRMEEVSPCGWKGCLHADGRAAPMREAQHRAFLGIGRRLPYTTRHERIYRLIATERPPLLSRGHAPSSSEVDLPEDGQPPRRAPSRRADPAAGP